MVRKNAVLCLGCIVFLLLAAKASLGDDELFRPAQSYFSGGYYAQAVAIGDVNGDHKPDVIVSNRCLSYPDDCHGLIGVLLGNGDGTFQPVATYPSGGYLPMSISDVNGDGKPDLIVGNSCLTSQDCDGGGALAGCGKMDAAT
jgi:hypothetical protein